MPGDLCSVSSLRGSHIPRQGFKNLNCSILKAPLTLTRPNFPQELSITTRQTAGQLPLCVLITLDFQCFSPNLLPLSFWYTRWNNFFFQAPFWNYIWLSLWTWYFPFLNWRNLLMEYFCFILSFEYFSFLLPEWALLWNGSEANQIF